MARTRNIKPEFFRHHDLYMAEVATKLPLRLAFAGLWVRADRRGLFRWHEELKLDVLPYDPVRFLDVLNALEAGGFVWSYVVEQRCYGCIPNFARHQHFNMKERPDMTIPDAPVRHGADTMLVSGQHSTSTGVARRNTEELLTTTATTSSTATTRSRSSSQALSSSSRNGNGLGPEDLATEARHQVEVLARKATVTALVLEMEPTPAEKAIAVVVASTGKREGKEHWRREAAGLVFAYWQAKLNHPRAKYDAKRERCIVNALRENGDDVGELFYAIDGVLRSPHNTGQNSTGDRWDDLGLVLRDRDHIERFSGLVPAYSAGKRHPSLVVTLENDVSTP